MQHLESLAKSELGEEAVLYTTDPPTVAYWGGLSEVYSAVDFGPRQWVALNFFIQFMLNWHSGQTAPLNSEFYTGWYTHWGTPVANTCVSLDIKATYLLQSSPFYTPEMLATELWSVDVLGFA